MFEKYGLSDKPSLANQVTNVFSIHLMRTTMDYTILTTEGLAPNLAMQSWRGKMGVYVVFLGRKQKAVENRQFAKLLFTLANEAGVEFEPCLLNNHRCMTCPRCILFGASDSAPGGAKDKVNLLRRVIYPSAFSLEPVEQAIEDLTLLGISDRTVTAEQNFLLQPSVKPGVHFPSIITLYNASWKEVVMLLKVLGGRYSYGGEAGTMGKIKNTVMGITYGLSDGMTPYEMALKTRGRTWLDEDEDVLINRYYQDVLAQFPFETGCLVSKPDETMQLLSTARGLQFDRGLIESMFADAREYREQQLIATRENINFIKSGQRGLYAFTAEGGPNDGISE